MRLSAAILAALLLAAGGEAVRAQPQQAAPAPSGETVVARVDGEPITLAEVSEAARTLPEEVRGAPPQLLFPLLLDQMITQRALVNAARRAGLDKDPAVTARIRRAEEQELQQALIGREVTAAVSEDALRQRYEQAVASRQAEEEIRARHILVRSESEARAALAEVRRPGADFAEVARRRSSGPGAQEGGDLGFFKQGDMVPEFATAAFALQAGQISEAPVRSPFGWHVILVEERRTAPPPAFDDVRDQLRQQMLEEQVNAVVERIRTAAQVERFNLDGSPQQQRPAGGGLLDNASPPPPASPPRR